MKRSISAAVAAAVLVVSGAAWADGDAPVAGSQDVSLSSNSVYADGLDDGGGVGRSSGWSVLTGRTVGAGALVIHPEFGWPGISATLLYGSSSKFDIGGRFTFNYGYEGLTSVVPGLKFQAVMRFLLSDSGTVSVGLRLEPGIGLYFAGGGVAFNILLPVGVDIGFHLSEQAAVVLGVDMPMSLSIFSSQFGSSVQFNLPFQFGPGVEFKIDNNLMLTMNTRFGPFIAIGGGANVAFAFEVLMGIAIHL